jgi:hypothetical protein
LTLDVQEDRHGVSTMAHAMLVGMVTLGAGMQEASRRYYSLDAAVELTATRPDGEHREWRARSSVDTSSTSGMSAAQREASRQGSSAVLDQLVNQIRGDADFFQRL